MSTIFSKTFSNNVRGFENIKHPKGLPFEFLLPSPGYTGTNVTKEDFENDKEVIIYYKNLCFSGQGKETYIKADLQLCKKNYTKFLESLLIDLETIDEFMNSRLPSYLKDFWKNGLDFWDYSSYDVDGEGFFKSEEEMLRERLEEGTFSFSLENISAFDKKLWKKCGGDVSRCAGDVFLFHITGENYNKFIEKVLKDKPRLGIRNLYSMFIVYSQAEELRKGAEEFLNDYLNPLIEQLGDILPVVNNNSVIETPDQVADESPVAQITEETPSNDSPYKDKPYWDNLSRVFINFPRFEIDFPLMMRKEVIKEDEKYPDRIQWIFGSGALAAYFHKFSESGSDWRTLEKLFTDKKGKKCDGSISSWRVQINRGPTYSAKELFEMLRRG